MSVFDGYGPTFSQVEYTAERVMSRRVLEPIFEEWYEESEEQAMKEGCFRFAMKSDGVIVPDTWETHVDSDIDMCPYPVVLGPVVAWQWEPRRKDVMVVTAWVWPNVRQEHRSQLLGWRHPHFMHVRMLVAEHFGLLKTAYE